MRRDGRGGRGTIASARSSNAARLGAQQAILALGELAVEIERE
jgi:hypothetical protein